MGAERQYTYRKRDFMEVKVKEAGVPTDFKNLEKTYKSPSQQLQPIFLTFVFCVMMVLAYTLFGTRVDREKFTTDVTPIHVEINPISDQRQTAQNPRSLQL
jgi:hypothetical protein